MPVVSDEDLARAVDAEAGWIEDADVSSRGGSLDARQRGARPGGRRASALRELGLEPVDVPMDADASCAAIRSRRPSAGTSRASATLSRPGRPSGAGGRSLALNGHVDVVPPAAAELWTADPFAPVRDGDWLVGRGAGDMKAGLAAMLGAVRALRGLGLAPLADLQLQSVVEEECGGNGALQCVLALPPVDACVIPEPFPGFDQRLPGRRPVVPRRALRRPCPRR